MIDADFHSEAFLAACRKYHVRSMSLFGSAVRGEARVNSDIDLLVTFSRPLSLLKMVALERELSESLGRKVDLHTERSLSRYLRTRILRERQLVYAA
jgi:predicted nucleotidyltransferase